MAYYTPLEYAHTNRYIRFAAYLVWLIREIHLNYVWFMYVRTQKSACQGFGCLLKNKSKHMNEMCVIFSPSSSMPHVHHFHLIHIYTWCRVCVVSCIMCVCVCARQQLVAVKYISFITIPHIRQYSRRGAVVEFTTRWMRRHSVLMCGGG